MKPNNSNIKNQKNEISDNHFSKKEDELLREGLNRSHTERFLFATRLFKIQKTMEKFSIVHRPNNSSK